ncbi:hypothetical protein BDW74DRAFT_174440 [Aspergillus multicolor]|uniref:uncharacterized protein n=1 Tax=Aspergillus multicolor TaxID=41759 RepID=UPI003CCDC229
MAQFFEPIGLTPLDHITAKIYLPYMLYFDSNDSNTAVDTLRKGLDKPVEEIPWLAGDVVIHTKPDTRAFVHPPQTPPHEVAMLTIKHFGDDQAFRMHPTREYLALPLFVPASQQRLVLRFQANIFPSKIALVMSFCHTVFDGSGAGMMLQTLSECRCAAARGSTESAQTPTTQTIRREAIAHRGEVSSWALPSQCQTHLDHSLELGPSAFDSNLTTDQWGAMESALSLTSSTSRLTFSAKKVADLKALCTRLLPQFYTSSASGSDAPSPSPSPSSIPFSSNDIITAALGISINRTMHPDRIQTDTPSHILVADLRHRVTPPLPETYLGNMVYPVWNRIPSLTPPPTAENGHTKNININTPSNHTDLLSLTQLSLDLRTKVVSNMNSTLTRSVCAAVAEHGNWYGLEGKPADVVMTSWRHLKVYTLDFGPKLGYIEDFESGFSLMPGACIMLPKRTRGGDGETGELVDWEVAVTLRAGGGEFERLGKDPLLKRILA